MASDQPDGQSLNYAWLRALRPLLWWFLLVLVIFGVIWHRHMMEKARLNYTVALANHQIFSDATVMLDGQPASNGQRLSLGKHTLTVRHPQADQFQTNFFAWYGGRDFGQINLHRSFGRLNVQSATPISRLSIAGQEFSTELSEVPTSALEVPTDTYKIVATYPHWSLTKTVVVTEGATADCFFEPHFGALTLTCNYENAIFRILDPDNKNIESGLIPATVTSLPVGVYQLVVTAHGHELKKDVHVALNQTNAVAAEFVFGAVTIETTPDGVDVADENGKVLGQSPVKLAELIPGKRLFTLQKTGFESIQVALNIEADRTNSISTNLVNGVYLAALAQARQNLATNNYAKALIAVQQALDANPGDADASALQREARGRQAIQMAKNEGARNNFASGVKFLETALQSMPDNDEAKNLLSDYQQRALAQAEQLKAEQLNQLQNEFDSWMSQNPDSSLFDTHELKTTKSSQAVAAAIRETLVNDIPQFKLTRDDSPKPGLFAFDAEQEIMTYMNTSGGRRRCVIMVGQTKDDEIKVLFKIIEYKTEAVNKFSIGNMIGTPVAVNYVALDASKGNLNNDQKIQIAGGIHFVTERIQKAISQP